MHGAFASLLTVLFVCSVEAQQAAPSDGLLPALRRAETNSSFVRVLLRDSTLTEGRVRWVRSTTVVVEKREISLNNILRVDRRVRSGGSGITGGFIGAAVLGWLGLELGGDSDSGGSRLLWLGAAAAGALLGFLIGEGIGPADHDWETAWP